jgi:hypothetical protein
VKNLLTYVNKDKKFDENTEKMAEIQIDNSLYFWKPEDILIATNFPYEYHGIKSIVVPDNLWCDFHPKASKPGVLIYLIENGLDELTWVHDFDAFQQEELNPIITKDLALTSYGYKDEINYGSFFFKPKALKVFKLNWEYVQRYQTHDEEALNILIREKDIDFQMMNQTYNIGIRCTRSILKLAERPIRVTHFPPYEPTKFHKFLPFLTKRLTELLCEKFTYLYQPQQRIRRRARNIG